LSRIRANTARQEKRIEEKRGRTRGPIDRVAIGLTYQLCKEALKQIVELFESPIPIPMSRKLDDALGSS
jgi:hypothetical protein